MIFVALRFASWAQFNKTVLISLIAFSTNVNEMAELSCNQWSTLLRPCGGVDHVYLFWRKNSRNAWPGLFRPGVSFHWWSSIAFHYYSFFSLFRLMIQIRVHCRFHFHFKAKDEREVEKLVEFLHLWKEMSKFLRFYLVVLLVLLLRMNAPRKKRK